MTFRITVQDARVIERSYNIEAPDADEARELFYELDGNEAADFLVREEVAASNWDIVDCQPCE